MFNRLRKARRGVSEVLATVIIISLVLAATALVSALLTNVNIVDLFGISVVPETKEVNLSMDVQLINSTDGDARTDTVIVFLSLDADSPNIYIQDADIQLPTEYSLQSIFPAMKWDKENQQSYSRYYFNLQTIPAWIKFKIFRGSLPLFSLELLVDLGVGLVLILLMLVGWKKLKKAS